jgi:hypothetical protein
LDFKERQPSPVYTPGVMTIGAQDTELPFKLTPLDRQVLAQTDEEYQAHTWEELKEIIGR